MILIMTANKTVIEIGAGILFQIFVVFAMEGDIRKVVVIAMALPLKNIMIAMEIV